MLGRRGFALGAATLALAGRADGKGPAAVRVGYCALTWADDNVKEAIADIAQLGYRGTQLRVRALQQFPSPAELKVELARAGLTFVCLSGGGPDPDPTRRASEIDKFMPAATFAKAAGALTIQATGPNRRGTAPTRALLEDYARTLTEIGKRTADLGLPLAFHPHMEQIGRTPEEVDIILAASDPRYVKLLLDTGHYAAAGGDPARAIQRHARRLVMLHIKDWRPRPASATDGAAYEFVELGQGKLGFPPVFRALRQIRYSGWALVEMEPDSVRPDRSAREAALANKKYLSETLGLTV